MATGLALVVGHGLALALLVVDIHLWPWAVGIVVVTHGVFLLGTLVANSSLFGPVIRSFETDKKELWLTIDDGLDPKTTPAILDVLEEFGAKATFFAIGETLERYPELEIAVRQAGHAIGNHSRTHPHKTFWMAGPWRVKREIGNNTDLFRAPVGMANWFVHAYLHRQGARPIGWSARGLDGIATAKERVVARLRNLLAPGAIVVLHEGYTREDRGYSADEILREVFEIMRESGYSAVVPAKEAHSIHTPKPL